VSCMAFHTELDKEASWLICGNFYCKKTPPNIGTSPNGFGYP